MDPLSNFIMHSPINHRLHKDIIKESIAFQMFYTLAVESLWTIQQQGRVQAM